MPNMRELFEEFEATPPLDPTEAARRNMRSLRKRFYERAEVVETPEGFGVVLDGKPVRTPARRALAAPSRSLGETLAAEWGAVGEMIDPAAMPLTRLANSIIDGVATTLEAVRADVAKFLRSDLVFYRAGEPAGLVVRQALHWDPVLTWARETHGARFVLSEGVMFVAQPDTAVKAAGAAIPTDPWRVGAVHSVTTLTGSALLALALAHGALDADGAWAAAHVDEDWQMEQWGRDDIALKRRAFRRADLDAAATVLAAE
jgi:chaperone required for assembly of F1-ATPase